MTLLQGRREGGRASLAVLAFFALLLMPALACEQAGEVLTPEEATARAQGPDEVESVDVETSEGLDVGDRATLVGTGFLINILDEPGGRLVANQERGVVVEITDVTQVDDEIWYEIAAPTGSGWVAIDNLEVMAGEPAAEEDEAGTTEEDSGRDAEGAGEGDTVYLTGTGFLINILNEPGGRLVANQERGAEVIVMERTEVDGEVWYRIDAPTGEGWVAAENITTEAP